MSNLETSPDELTCGADPSARGGQLIEPRAVPLGGPRGMTVRRTLPQRARSLIGAWCFVDHYGPDEVGESGGMHVPGHPHTGLQTVSWLFEGTIEHRDTTGEHALVRPGELNLMTAGSGIAHSEFSTSDTHALHGVQLWAALPERHRFVEAGFEHYAPPRDDLDGAGLRVFLGTLAGRTSPATTYSPLLGAEITLPAGHVVVAAVDSDFEHGVLVDTGEVSVGGLRAGPGRLVYRPPGSSEIELRAGAEPARVLLLGGEPLAEEIVMWWNFIGRSHEEIVEFRARWMEERSRPDGRGGGARRYGRFPSSWSETLPAPELPNARLTPRR
ncbi:MAG: pirin family protein [Pseudonocardia sp.]|nr:pirin family protein [Pseudonocardia sp.]